MLCLCSAVLLTLTGQSWGVCVGSCPCPGAHLWDGVSLLLSVALSLQATETGEPRGQDGSGRRGPPRRGAQASRASTTDLGEHPKGPRLG